MPYELSHKKPDLFVLILLKIFYNEKIDFRTRNGRFII